MTDRTSTSAAQRAARAEAISARRRAGDSWAQIASRFGLSERQARRAYTQVVASEPLPHIGALRVDMAAEFREVVAAHREAIDALRAAGAEADSSSAGVGAWRAMATTSAQLWALLLQWHDLTRRQQAHHEVRALLSLILDAAQREGLDVARLSARLAESPQGRALLGTTAVDEAAA